LNSVACWLTRAGIPVLAGTMLLVSAFCTPSSAQTPQPPLIAQACVGCHGQAGAGKDRIPRIAGYDRELFLAQFAAFRNKQRPATIMDRVASGYTEAEIALLADYFSKLKPATQTPKRKSDAGPSTVVASAMATQFKVSAKADRVKASARAAKAKPRVSKRQRPKMVARASFFDCGWWWRPSPPRRAVTRKAIVRGKHRQATINDGSQRLPRRPVAVLAGRSFELR
jgi:cytochrome subunit of sulfide dehydrogenase